MRNNQMRPITILTMLLSLVLLTGGCLQKPDEQKKSVETKTDTPQAHPTPEPEVTSGGLYTNNEYGFTLEYPKEWAVQENNERSRIDFFSPETMQRNCPVGCESDMRIRVLENQGHLSLQKFYDGKKSTNLYSDAAGIQNISLADHPAVYFKNVLGEITEDIIVIPVKDRIYEISFSVDYSSMEKFISSLTIKY